MKRRTQRGFTLLELMIVVVVIAILASFAVSNYSRYAMRTRRADAKEMLMRIAAAEERHYTSFNKYTKNLKDDLGFSSDTPPTEKGYYTIKIADVDASALKYTLSAEPVAGGAQGKDACKTLSLASSGTKDKTGDESNGKCW